MATYDTLWVVRYVDGELTPEEQAEFEAGLQSDTELAATVALYREVKATLQQRLPDSDRQTALLGQMQSLRGKYFGPGSSVESTSDSAAPVTSSSATNSGVSPSESPVRTIPGQTRTSVPTTSPGASTPVRPMRTRLRWLTGIAALVLVGVAMLTLWPSDKTKLYQQLGQTEMIGTTERGDNTDTLLQRATFLFNHEQFTEALPLLNRAAQADTGSQLVLFYRGVTAWHTGDLEMARASLHQVYDNGSLLKEEAAFYIALTYATEKKKEMALEWLKKIPPTDPEYLKSSKLEEALK